MVNIQEEEVKEEKKENISTLKSAYHKKLH